MAPSGYDLSRGFIGTGSPNQYAPLSVLLGDDSERESSGLGIYTGLGLGLPSASPRLERIMRGEQGILPERERAVRGEGNPDEARCPHGSRSRYCVDCIRLHFGGAVAGTPHDDDQVPRGSTSGVFELESEYGTDGGEAVYVGGLSADDAFWDGVREFEE